MRSFFLFLCFGLCFLRPPPLFAQVVISEVMWAGSDLSSSDEWMEIVNASDAPVDISGWSLTYAKSTGAETTMATFASGTLMLPDQHFLIGSKHEPDSRLAREPDLFASSLVLPNTKLLITLKDALGAVMDQADDGTGSPFAGANPSGTGAKASMERIDLLASGSLESNWRTGTDTTGFDADVSIFGTPGFANGADSPTCGSAGPICDTSSSDSSDSSVSSVSSSCFDSLSIQISVQSGELKGIDKTTVNFEAIALSGSLTGLTCRWSCTDGFSSDSCNPSPHAFMNTGITVVNLTVVNHCGNTLLQSLNVEVIPTSSSSPASSPNAAVAYDGSRIIIAGVMPNPTGADSGREWMELLNGEDRTVSLAGYELVLGETKQQRYRLTGSLQERGVLRIWNSEIKFKLKNTAETLRLIAPNGDVLSTVTWESPEEERVYFPTEIRGVTVRGTVVRVIDGDTLDLSVDPDAERVLGRDTVRVRLLGVDAPELMSDKDMADLYSSEAAEFLRALTEGKRVELEFDTELWDGFGRLLAYVYSDGGVLIEDQLLVNGMVRVMESFPYRKKELFLDLQERARNSRIGVWSLEKASALTVEKRNSSGVLVAALSGSSIRGIAEHEEIWNHVSLSEIFPSPDPKAESDRLSFEWIELSRTGLQPLSLSGWTLTVGKKSRVLDPRISFGSGRFLLIAAGEWKLQLPNAGGTVVLRSPDGLIVADVTYPSLKSSQSYAWDGGSEAFCLSIPTPLSENHCAGSASPPKRTSTAGKKTIAYAAAYREQLRDGGGATIDVSGGASGDDVSASWLLFMTLPGAALGVLGTVFGMKMGWLRGEK
ncbi:MAG: lamin tail domain-containing protein [Candidatus Peribacteraceae bacterium]|nr:lamin tail domain-containing protein [Candidatus Peribacteraceae bacterium]